MKLKQILKPVGRICALLLCAVLPLASWQSLAVFAQEAPQATPTTEPTLIFTPTPTPTENLVVDNTNTTVEVDADATANTGGNFVGEETSPTPTPDILLPPSILPIPTVTDEFVPESTTSAILIDNSATVESSVSATANTGNNTITNPDGNASQTSDSDEGQQTNSPTPTVTPTPESTSSATITTGDSLVAAQIDNAVNTTSVNSQVVYHTINLYLDEIGNIDLSLVPNLASLLVNQQPDQATINASLTNLDITNEATTTNNIDLAANTGGNIATESATAQITTGNAYTILSLLNRINLVMIDSVLHVAIINIFADFNGNIFLPDLPTPAPTPCVNCGATTIENTATVTNNVSLVSDTGNNTVEAQTGSIKTGQAQTAVNLVNLVNTVIYNSQHLALYINNFGSWNGSFLGWGNASLPANSETVLSAPACSTCINEVKINNTAEVTNNINLSSTTGNNTISATGEGKIETGNAYTAGSILNLVNTSFIKSFGLFGFINIFGNWTGNIGSKSLFATSENSEGDDDTASQANPPAENASAGQSSNDSDNVRESGGQLIVTNSNNVGEYVLPGDTVTLFVNTKNPGTGKVYETKLTVTLTKDDVSAGTTVFELGDITAGRSIKLTTGMVLSQNAPTGLYTVRATAKGFTGQDQTPIEASADSFFNISGPALTATTVNPEEPIASSTVSPTVLGTTRAAKSSPNLLRALLVLLLLGPAYVCLRLTKEGYQLQFVFARELAFAARLRALRLFLL